MKRTRFQIHPDLFYTDSVSQGVKRVNCDAIIVHIQKFYNEYEEVLSMADKKQLLDMLTRIQWCKKLLPASEKDEMYKNLGIMQRRYARGER